MEFPNTLYICLLSNIFFNTLHVYIMQCTKNLNIINDIITCFIDLLKKQLKVYNVVKSGKLFGMKRRKNFEPFEHSFCR